jgi:hypothetical protein
MLAVITSPFGQEEVICRMADANPFIRRRVVKRTAM